METVQRVRYLKVEWHHDLNDEPILLLSEINDGREVRKIEHYPDGHAQFAGPDDASGDTHLSETLMPTPEELAAEQQFTVLPITSDEFEAAWHAATTSSEDPSGSSRPELADVSPPMSGEVHDHSNPCEH